MRDLFEYSNSPVLRALGLVNAPNRVALTIERTDFPLPTWDAGSITPLPRKRGRGKRAVARSHEERGASRESLKCGVPTSRC